MIEHVIQPNHSLREASIPLGEICSIPLSVPVATQASTGALSSKDEHRLRHEDSSSARNRGIEANRCQTVGHDEPPTPTTQASKRCDSPPKGTLAADMSGTDITLAVLPQAFFSSGCTPVHDHRSRGTFG